MERMRWDDSDLQSESSDEGNPDQIGRGMGWMMDHGISSGDGGRESNSTVLYYDQDEMKRLKSIDQVQVKFPCPSPPDVHASEKGPNNF